MRLVRMLVLVAASLVVTACAGGGREFDATHAREVQKGVQNKEQIEAWFGAPYQSNALTSHPADCTERWTYTHAWANWGGAQTSVKTLVVDFDSEGVVCDHAYVEQ